MAFSSSLSPISLPPSFTSHSEATSLCSTTFGFLNPPRRSCSKFRGLNSHLLPSISPSRTVVAVDVSSAGVANASGPVTSFSNVIGLLSFPPFSFLVCFSFIECFLFFFVFLKLFFLFEC